MRMRDPLRKRKNCRRSRRLCAFALIFALLAGCGQSAPGTKDSTDQTESVQGTDGAENAGTDSTGTDGAEQAGTDGTGTDGAENAGTDSAGTESEKAEAPQKEKGALNSLPSKYWLPNKNAGTVVRVDYETDAYGSTISKYAYVYLPYGYDENKQYDVLYCLHGGGGEIDAYFNTSATPAKTKILFDNMIANGDIDPIIAVSPTYYGGSGSSVDQVTEFSKKELINDLIPAVEGTYSTYAESTDPEGIKASREHRAYSGFSMGALSTWYTFVYCLDYFYYFIPISGDCWVNGTHNAVGGAIMLEKVCAESGYGEDDFFIYAVTGDQDIAYSAMQDQMKAMKTNSPSFRFVTEDNAEGNICFRVQPKARHDYFYMPLYYYNALPTLWRGGPVYDE